MNASAVATRPAAPDSSSRTHTATLLAFFVAAAGCATDPLPPAAPATASRLFVADEEDGTVSVIDLATHTRIASIPLIEQYGNEVNLITPSDLAVAPDGLSVWVAGPPGSTYRTGLPPTRDPSTSPTPLEDWEPRSPDEIIVIEPARGVIETRIHLEEGARVSHLVIDRDSRYVYATERGLDDVVRIDLRTRRIAGHIALGAGHAPLGLALCDRTLYVANETSKSLSIVDTATDTVQDIALAGAPTQPTCTSDGRYVFVTMFEAREVVRYEPATRSLVRIALPADAAGPAELTVRPDGLRLYVCDQGHLRGRPDSRRIYEIDVESATIVATVGAGTGPHAVVFDDTGATAYATNVYDGTVSVIDTATREISATIAVGHRPTGLGRWSGSLR